MGNNSNMESTIPGGWSSGLVFALAIVLTATEDAFPSLPLPVPGVKLGLSNIAVMYALFSCQGRLIRCGAESGLRDGGAQAYSRNTPFREYCH